MAKRIFADLKGQTAVLIGAGEMIRLVAQHLQRHGVGRIVVANRSLERAEHLAREVHGYAISLNDLHTYLPDADLVIASTAAREFIVSGEQMERAVKSRRRKPVLMIDLAVPRDIDPKIAELEDIYLYTIDDLRNVISENLKLRQEAARPAEFLITTQAQQFTRWLESGDAGNTLRMLGEQARSSRDAEIGRANG